MAPFVPYSSKSSSRFSETATSFRYRVRPSEQFQPGSLRTLPVRWKGRPVLAVIGRPNDSSRTTRLQSIIFPKEHGWTQSTAQSWIRAPQRSETAHAQRDTERPAEAHDQILADPTR
jgi:hypothetical protein